MRLNYKIKIYWIFYLYFRFKQPDKMSLPPKILKNFKVFWFLQLWTKVFPLGYDAYWH